MNVVLVATYELGHQPFGLSSPAAWLARAGHEVLCLDLSVGQLDEPVVQAADLGPGPGAAGSVPEGAGPEGTGAGGAGGDSTDLGSIATGSTGIGSTGDESHGTDQESSGAKAPARHPSRPARSGQGE